MVVELFTEIQGLSVSGKKSYHKNGGGILVQYHTNATSTPVVIPSGAIEVYVCSTGGCLVNGTNIPIGQSFKQKVNPKGEYRLPTYEISGIGHQVVVTYIG